MQNLSAKLTTSSSDPGGREPAKPAIDTAQWQSMWFRRYTTMVECLKSGLLEALIPVQLIHLWIILGLNGTANGEEWREARLTILSGKSENGILKDTDRLAVPAYYSTYSPHLYTINPLQVHLADPLNACRPMAGPTLSSGPDGTPAKKRSFALLAETGGCTNLMKVHWALEMEASALLLYDPKLTHLQNRDPLRINTRAGQQLDILLLGISQSAGVTTSRHLLLGYSVNATIAVSLEKYSGLITSTKILFFTCIVFASLGVFSLIAASVMYLYWLYQTRQRLRSQVSFFYTTWKHSCD